MLDKPAKLPDVYSKIKVTFDGGSEKDQQDVLLIYHTFMLANDYVDFELLTTIWDADPQNLFFNTNLFTYEGLGDWENIWNHYRPCYRLDAPYYPGRLRVVIRGNMASIAADGITRFKSWISSAPAFNPGVYRATKVLVKDDDEWRVVHAHFSISGEGVRPDKAGGAPKPV